MKLTPLKLNLLMHVYAIAEPFNHPDAPAWYSARSELVMNNLIDVSNKSPCGYSLTQRGRAFVKLILSTPMPEYITVYVDPRTTEVIKL